MLQAIQNDNYTEIFTTDLYNKNGCTYCALLGILNNLTDEVMLQGENSKKIQEKRGLKL